MSKIFNLPNLTLVTALTLSVIAAWYSILGLTTIFAAAVIPIIIMGSALEIAKVVTTVWLHAYWDKAKWTLKLYLVPAVIVLAILTSMGIFGFLSKAHTDQSLVSGDVQAQIAIYDEKIKIAKENIDANRRALKQMDEAVDQVMGRSTTEQGAERSVQIRRQQGPERRRLINEIEAEQKKITQLNEARAPIAAEVRKVEAEVGPIKYIAALIYGDNPDANLLERSVRWVIILIVAVFDPLALTLVLAANASRHYRKDEPIIQPIISVPAEPVEPVKEPTIDPITEHATDTVHEELCPKCDSVMEDVPNIGFICTSEQCKPQQIQEDEYTLEKHSYLNKKWVGFKNLKPIVYIPEKKIDIDEINKELQELIPESELPEIIEPTSENTESEILESKLVEPIPEDTKPKVSTVEIKTEGITSLPKVKVDGDYATFDGKHMHIDALKSLHPELFLKADSMLPVQTGFGTAFPKVANKGDVFVRVDVLPNKVYKFDGFKWIEINKTQTSSYLYDQKYLQYLIEKIDKGEYDVELLSDNEKSLIEEYLKNQNS